MIVPAWFIVGAAALGLLLVAFGRRPSWNVLIWVGVVGALIAGAFWFGLTAAGGDPAQVIAEALRRIGQRLDRIESPIPAHVLSFWLFLNALGLIAAAALGLTASAIRGVVGLRRPIGAAPPPFVLAGLVCANAAFALAREPLQAMLGWA